MLTAPRPIRPTGRPGRQAVRASGGPTPRPAGRVNMRVPRPPTGRGRRY